MKSLITDHEVEIVKAWLSCALSILNDPVSQSHHDFDGVLKNLR